MKIALAQVTSTNDFQSNEKHAISWIRTAAERGVSLLAFPECFLFLGRDEEMVSLGEIIPGPIVESYQLLAQKYYISLLLGSIPEKIAEESRIYNTSVLINRNGDLLGTYRKIHLFDVSLPQVVFEESKYTKAGNSVCVISHEIGMIGIAVCYDLRFPNQFQRMREKGAEIIFLPAAFTLQTGKDHWLPLLQARAIENQVYIAAPAQFGQHDKKRVSYGNSVIIDPWGKIIARASEKEGLIEGEIDLEYLRDIRYKMPVFEHSHPIDRCFKE